MPRKAPPVSYRRGLTRSRTDATTTPHRASCTASAGVSGRPATKGAPRVCKGVQISGRMVAVVHVSACAPKKVPTASGEPVHRSSRNEPWFPWDHVNNHPAGTIEIICANSCVRFPRHARVRVSVLQQGEEPGYTGFSLCEVAIKRRTQGADAPHREVLEERESRRHGGTKNPHPAEVL